MISTIIKRALRGFFAAAIAGIAAQLATGITITSLEDLKKLGITLLTAGLVAGLLALDKLIRYDDPQGPQTLTEVEE